MKLTRSYASIVLLLGLLAFLNMPAGGQETKKTTSHGEVARRLKAEREKQKQKPVAVFTNEDLPSRDSVGMGKSKTLEGGKEKRQSASANAAGESPSRKHGEKYFRSKADKIRNRMDFHRRQLAVLEQQLGLAKMQYYPDPQKTLEQESTPAFQSDLGKLRSKIAVAQKAIADDQKTMDDLQEELRREGGDPGWIR